MRHITTISRSLAATGVAGLLSLGLATSAFADPPEGAEANQPESWETFLEEEGYTNVDCTKLETGFEGSTWVSDDDYVLVVLNAGSAQSSGGDPNTLHWDVEEGEEIGTEDEKDISHIIACTGEKPTSSATPTPTQSQTPTPTPTSSMTPTPSVTTTPSMTPTRPGPSGPVVETDVPSTGSVTPAILGGAAVLAGLGLAAGAMRRRGEH